MARTIDDLILVDNIVRSSNKTTTAHGMVPQPVSCAAPISNISLNGTRIGLPSTFGWVTGLSGEVTPEVCYDTVLTEFFNKNSPYCSQSNPTAGDHQHFPSLQPCLIFNPSAWMETISKRC